MHEVTRRWGTRQQCLEHFNPSIQYKCGANSTLSVVGNYPSLAKLKTAYGENTPVAWLIPQLYSLSEFCGVKDKLSENMLEELAHIITNEFYYLKVTELMLFFYWFKTGKYGKFYGAVDPLVICEGLRKFLVERSNIIDRVDREREQLERAKMLEGCITYEEYKRRKEEVSNTRKPHALSVKCS